MRRKSSEVPPLCLSFFFLTETPQLKVHYESMFRKVCASWLAVLNIGCECSRMECIYVCCYLRVCEQHEGHAVVHRLRINEIRTITVSHLYCFQRQHGKVHSMQQRVTWCLELCIFNADADTCTHAHPKVRTHTHTHTQCKIAIMGCGLWRLAWVHLSTLSSLEVNTTTLALAHRISFVDRGRCDMSLRSIQLKFKLNDFVFPLRSLFARVGWRVTVH